MLFLSTYCRNPGLVGRGRSQSRLPRFFELGIPRMKPPSDSHQRLGRSAAKNPRDRRRLNRLRSVNIRFGLSSPPGVLQTVSTSGSRLVSWRGQQRPGSLLTLDRHSFDQPTLPKCSYPPWCRTIEIPGYPQTEFRCMGPA